MSGESIMAQSKRQTDDVFEMLAERKAANTVLFNSDKDAVSKFMGESGMSQDDFNASDPTETAAKFKQWKVGKADQAYLDTKTALLAAPGRKANLLADPIQGMGKLLGKSVL